MIKDVKVRKLLNPFLYNVWYYIGLTGETTA